MTPRHWTTLALAIVCFISLHALTIPQMLEDEDSVNLALGVEDFNVARYAPHPPGYPVFIGLAKISTATVSWLRPQWSRDRRAAAGLAWLSILFGAAGIVAFTAFWRGLGISPWWAIAAALGTTAAPLYWFTSARPLTDIPGLVAGVAIQAALLHSLRHVPTHRTVPALLVGAGFAAGLAIGLRSQTMWMTLPLLSWVLGSLARRGRWSQVAVVSAATMAGVLAWFIPLMVLSGGLAEYQQVLAGQGQHDFDSVRMLATHPAWSILREGLVRTFLTPWTTTMWPWAIVVAAMLGLIHFAASARHASARVHLLGLVVVPYLSFHLLFHEVETVRYALPTVSVVAGLAILALQYLRMHAGAIATAAVVTVAMVMNHQTTTSYAAGVPVFRVLNEISDARHATSVGVRLEAHHRAWWATSRAIDWQRRQETFDVPLLVNHDESLRLIDYWRSGATTPVWFLTDPDRSDLARFDPASSAHQSTYRLTPDVAALIGGLRVYDVGWWRLSPPAWMLGRGWALTPEMAAESADPSSATALLRRQTRGKTMFVGVRHLDTVPDAVDVVAALDGREVDRWTIAPGASVTRWIALPPGSLRGLDAYAALTFTVVSPHRVTNRTADRIVAFDQFDASSGARPMLALGNGWSPLEFDATHPASSWRRASRLSTIQLRHTGAPVRLTIRGSVPEGDFAVHPTVLVTAGDRLLGRFVPDDTFEESFDVPPDVLDQTGGEVVISVDLRRTPDERLRGVPYRDFGLRVMSVGIGPRPPD